ncbi:conserved hypothetical protein [Talaromyces stipitatus ATCC 10500]|uniref:Uncharacterized protein n=1 Tax=Talaromyces stipitatus (strain ATCC 10500 / CBS 375.48 / QM 6759 / NRRL 1006) TaxID=441959 RepID=B8M104_TALSN|nr:uncharacterized protein TSTA_090230 [Talaromyces stipitatus ATCC 10500]EED21784.1 conserved hypothetical protein [Talaromyces stipitatus ATCC 10500]
MQDHTRASALLSSALQDHGIRFKKEDVAAELDNGSQQGRDNAQWVLEHISPSTLLSKDEAAFVKNLERSGLLETFLRHPDLTSTRALTEDEIRESTATLKSSTAIYAKQVTVLRSQLELTERLQSDRREVDRNHDRYITGLNRRHLLDKQRIKAMAEDIKNDLESRMHEYQQQKHAERKYLLQNVSSKLVEDDEVLSKAEKLAAELESTEADGKLENHVLNLVSTLSKLSSAEIRCRLDRLYLKELLSDDVSPPDVSGNHRDTQIALEEDLESLYSEIEVLAEMSARQEFGQSILGELSKKKQHFVNSLEDTLDMILEVLSQMTHETEQEIDKVYYRQSHREALDQLSVLFKEEISSREAEQVQIKKAHRRHSSLSSPMKAPQPRTSIEEESLQSLESFLRRLGISPSSSLTAHELASEKKSELADIIHHNISIAAEMPLYETLGSNDAAKELLASILHADSHAQPSLVDHIEKEHLSDLEKELAVIQKDIEQLDLNVLVEPDRSRDKFVEKWSSP